MVREVPARTARAVARHVPVLPILNTVLSVQVAMEGASRSKLLDAHLLLLEVALEAHSDPP